MSLSLAPGASYALVGSERDGVHLLLAVLAGAIAPRAGTATIDGKVPAAGRAIAYVPRLPELPVELDVGSFLALASCLRGEPPAPPEQRLGVLGVAALSRRRIRTLALEESRAVALVEALTCRAPLVLLEDPLADLDPRAVGRVATALEDRVDSGATVLLSTASPGDARALAHDALFFEGGKLARRTTDKDAWAPPMGPRGARLFIRSEGARFLLAELASDPTFQVVRGEGADLVVTGKDPVAMAAAVGAAVRRANVELDLLEFQPSDGDA